MDYMKDIQEISDEQAVILWQAARVSLAGKDEKAPEILREGESVIGKVRKYKATSG